MVTDREVENYFIVNMKNTQVIGKMDRSMDWVKKSLLMEMLTSVNGKTDVFMVKV